MKHQFFTLQQLIWGSVENTITHFQQPSPKNNRQPLKTWLSWFAMLTILFWGILPVASQTKDDSGFTASANTTQHQDVPFTVDITKATGFGGAELDGTYDLEVESDLADGLVFSGTVDLTEGEGSFEMSLSQIGTHVLTIALEGVTSTRNLTIQNDPDYSNFFIDSPGDQVANIAFNIELTAAQARNGSALDGEYNVTVTSNEETDGEVFNEEDVVFSSGGATISDVILSEEVIHTLTIEIEGVTNSKDVDVEVAANSSSVTFRDYLNDDDETITSMTAGDPLKIELEELRDQSGSLLDDTDQTVIVESTDDGTLFNEDVTFDENGDGVVNIPSGRVKTANATYTFDISIEGIGLLNLSTNNLEVNAGTAEQFIVDSQPTTATGDNDGGEAELDDIIIKIADQYGNPSNILNSDGDVISGVEIFIDITSGPEGSLGGTTGSDGSGLDFDETNNEYIFDDLTIDTEANYILTVKSADGAALPGETVDLQNIEVTNIDNNSDLVITNSGPQEVDVPFDLELTNARDKSGSLLNGDFDVEVRSRLISEQTIPPFNIIVGTYNSIGTYSVNFTEGIGQVNFSLPNVYEGDLFNDSGFDNVQIILDPTDINFTRETKIEVVTEDDSGFNVSDPLPDQLAGNGFDISITGATDAANDPLSEDKYVTVTSSNPVEGNDGVIYDGDVEFEAGDADIPVVLNVAGTQTLTIEIDWVTDSQTTSVTVDPSVIVVDSDNNQVDDGDNAFDFGEFQFGYTSAASETFTITRIGNSDVENLEVTIDNTTDFTLSGSGLGDIDLIGSTTTKEFTLEPKTGGTVGVYTVIVTVTNTNATPAGNVTYTFEASFEVTESYSITVEDDSDNDLLDENNTPLEFETLAEGYADAPSETITIGNSGTGDLEGISVSLEGPNGALFDVTEPASTTLSGDEDPDATTTFDVSPVTDLEQGIYNAIVRIRANNDSSVEVINETFEIQFQVTASGLDITLEPSGSLDMGLFSAGYNPGDAEQIITIRNTGEDATTKIEILDDDADPYSSSEFQITGPAIQELDPGETTTITVTPQAGNENALLEGGYSKIIRIRPNENEDADETITVYFGVDDVKWKGGAAGDEKNWDNTDNWEPESETIDNVAIAPNENVDIIIPDVDDDPEISTSNVRIFKGLTIETGASLVVKSGRTLNIDGTSGSVTNNGTLEINGTLNNESDADIDNEGTFTIGGTFNNSGTFDNSTGSGTFTIQPNARVTSTGTITNTTGNVDNFTIQSNASGTGSLIVNNDGVHATVQRWMKQDQWHMVAVPVTGQNIQDFIDHNTGNNDDHANIRQGDTESAIQVYEDVGGWSSFFSSTGNTGNFSTNEAYSMSVDSDGYIEFKGELEYQNNSVSLNNNSDGYFWTGLGNPFSAPVAVSQLTNSFLNDYADLLTPEQAGLWIWDDSDSQYVIINNVDADQAYIDVGQAFIVKGTTAGGSVDLKASYRSHQSPEFFKNEQPSDWVIFDLFVAQNDLDYKTRLAFNPGMTKNLDVTYDAGLFNDDADLLLYTKEPDATNDLKMSIQALPDYDLSEVDIPVGVRPAADGDVTFSMIPKHLPEFFIPLLYDQAENTYTDLRTKEYTVSVNTDDPETGRFFLQMRDLRNQHQVSFIPLNDGGEIVASDASGNTIVNGETVQEGSALVFSAIPAEGFKLDKWFLNSFEVMPDGSNELMVDHITSNTVVNALFAPKLKAGQDENQNEHLSDLHDIMVFLNDHRQIVLTGTFGEGTVAEVYDVLGNKVLVQDMLNLNVNLIETAGLNDGVYFVHIIENNEHFTKKIFIR